MDFPRTGFRGVITPLLTPLTESEELDRDALSRLVEHVLDGGVSALFAMGTSAEFANFGERMWNEVVARVVECADGRVPVLAGITHCGTRAAVALARRAKQLGAGGAVAAPPYYYSHGGSNAIERHYAQIADDSPLPVFLYNMPRFTGVSLGVDFVLGMADHQNILGLKDSSNDGIYFQGILRRLGGREDFAVLQGCEFLLAMSLDAGGCGAVSGISNVFPQWLTGLVNAHFDGDTDTVRDLQGKLLDFLPFVRMAATPLPTLKAATEILGLAPARLSAPFEGLTDEQRERLAQFVRDNYGAENPAGG